MRRLTAVIALVFSTLLLLPATASASSPVEYVVLLDAPACC